MTEDMNSQWVEAGGQLKINWKGGKEEIRPYFPSPSPLKQYLAPKSQSYNYLELSNSFQASPALPSHRI